MRKKTCKGCKALDVERRCPCLLGFNVDKIPVDTRLGVGYNYYPSEECPKPKTLTRFVELSLGRKI